MYHFLTNWVIAVVKAVILAVKLFLAEALYSKFFSFEAGPGKVLARLELCWECSYFLRNFTETDLLAANWDNEWQNCLQGATKDSVNSDPRDSNTRKVKPLVSSPYKLGNVRIYQRPNGVGILSVPLRDFAISMVVTAALKWTHGSACTEGCLDTSHGNLELLRL